METALQFAHHGLVAIPIDDMIRGGEVLDDTELRVDVVLHLVVVAIHVVGSDVHDHCDVCAELVHVVQLEARQFDDVIVEVLGGHLQGERLAHVACQSYIESAGLENVVGHHRGSGLPVGAGDTDHLGIGVSTRELDLGDDGCALLHEFDDERGGEGHTWALDHLIGIENELLGMGMSILVRNLVLFEQHLVFILDG